MGHRPGTPDYSAPHGGRWPGWRLFGGLLAVLVFLTFPWVVLGLETFVFRDYGLFSYPVAYFQRQCFWAGELPFWNPYNNCGIPVLAQWNTMPLYPPAVFYLLFPLEWSLSFFCLAHLCFGGLGMYRLAAGWSGSALAGAVAGVVFAFGGLTQNFLMWPSHTATFSWMPWVVWLVSESWRTGGRRIAGAALAGAMQMLAGGPETILFTWLFLGALLVISVWKGRKLPAQPKGGPAIGWTYAGWFGCIAVMVLALAAIQLLPFLDLAAHSQRNRNFSDLRWSLPWRGWANLLVPLVFGSTWREGVFLQNDQVWTSSYYVGAGTLLLALWAIVAVRDARVRLLAATGFAAFLLSYGDKFFLYGWVLKAVPVFKLMTFPVKFTILVAFTAPLLAAFGLAHLVEATPRQKRKAAWAGVAILGLIGAIVVWQRLAPFPGENVSRATLSGVTRGIFLCAELSLVIAASRFRLVGKGFILGLALPLVAWLDLRTHAWPQNPTAPTAIYRPNLARAELAMSPQPGLGGSRVMVSPAADVVMDNTSVSEPGTGYLARRLGYFSDCNLLDEVPKVNGFFSLYPRQGYQIALLLYLKTNSTFPRLEDFLSVSHRTAPGEFTAWQTRNTFLPLATAGQEPVFLDDTNTVARLIRPDFNPAKVVFLPVSSRGSVQVTNSSDTRVLSQRFERQRAEIEVEAGAASLVVISQTYYHRWKARVDGAPTPLLRANYAFQAVQVPAGRHRVELIYTDPAFSVGAVISVLGLCACLAFWRAARVSAKETVGTSLGVRFF